MKEILTDLMNQLCFYPLALTASTLLAALAPASRPSLALWMLGALPVFFLYYTRKRCKHLSVLLLLHGLVLACFYIIPAANGVNRGIRLLVGAGFVIYSLWLRFRTEDFASDPLPLPLAAGIAFLCLFSAALSGKQRLGSLLSYESDPGVFIVCCHFVFAVL